MPKIQRAKTDILSRMQNREKFSRVAQKMIATGEAEGMSVAYLRLLNVDAFAVRYGADAGDDVLKSVATELLRRLGSKRAGRLTSGAFLGLIRTDEVESYVRDLNQMLPNAGEPAGIVLKVGYCELNDARPFSDFLDRARYAFDDIRYDSPAWARLFDRGLETAFDRRAYVVERLDDAIARGEIRVYAQPIVRVLTGMVCEVECLARWESERFGFLSPAEFIPELERAQLIHRLDSEVVRTACRQWAEAAKCGISVPFGINLSRLDFELTDIYSVVTDAMATYGVPVDQIHIEVTESALARSSSMLMDGIDRFRAAGFTLYLDDFGSGYSSLRVLEGTRFDVVKLDMSLLREVEANERARVIVADAVSMVKRLALQTLCEGVETEEQFLFLKAVGCEKAQGYFFGRPMNHEETMAELERTADMHERPEDIRYYDLIGHVNLMDGTHASTQGIEAAHFLGTQPFALAEVRESAVSFLAANSAFHRLVNRLHGSSVQELENDLTGYLSDIRKKGLYTASKARKTCEQQQFDFVIDGNFCSFAVSFIDSSEGREAFLVEVLSVTQYSQYNNFRLLERSLRFLYSIFKRIDLLDVTDNTWNNIYLNVARYSVLRSNGTPADEIDAFAETFIHPDDRDRFRAFYDLDTVDERLANGSTLHLADSFYTVTDNGRYENQFFMLIPMSLDNHKQYLSCMRDLDTHGQVRSNLSGVARISDAVLLSGLLNATDRSIFWKDERRRFLGANQAFLDYYGFGDVDEIRGRTDEELGWGIRNRTFRDDELRVLSGEFVSNVRGITIRDGVLRNMIMTKMPLFREGRVVGLVGYFSDVGKHVTYDDVVEDIRQRVLARGYRRTVLLGTPEVMAQGLLRHNLAASGIMVLAPGEAERTWIGTRLHEGFAGEDLERLRSLLGDAMSHGADSIVACHQSIVLALEEMASGLPFVDASKVSWF